MSNPKKRFDFENSFGDGLRSPKRPKLEVIQRPSGSVSRNESFENTDDNEDLWGDELETDAVEEVLLLESQACSLKPQTSSSHTLEKTFSGPSAVFQPKTAVVSTARSAFLCPEPTSSSKPSDSGAVFKGNTGPFATPASTSHAIKPLMVEKVKTNVIGKGCQRSSSFPAISAPQTSSNIRTPWVEGKGSKERFPSSGTFKEVSATKSSTDEEQKKLKEEVERLKVETLTKSGEAALLRQKIKDAGLELEKERQNRSELLEKINQKHQEEIAAIRRELEAAKTQLQFKEHDVDDALEKCKLLKSGAIKVRQLDVKPSSPSRPSTSGRQQDFPNRSSFEGNTPRKKPALGKRKGRELMEEEEFSNEVPSEQIVEQLRAEVTEAGIQTEKSTSRRNYNYNSRSREGCLLSNMIVPYWFEMDSGATEEHFEGRWEGIAIVTDLLKMDTFEGNPLEQMVNWCWQRLIDFISTLNQIREEDLQFDQKKEESRRQYEEWCLDRRIPLPPENSAEDEGFQNEWFPQLAEDSMADELQSLLSHRPWCPNDSVPEIRRTFGLAIALMRASKNMAYAFGSHNVKERKKHSSCFVCGCSIKNEDDESSTSKEENEDSKETAGLPMHRHTCESFENILTQSPVVISENSELPRTSKGNQKSLEGEKVPTSKEVNFSLMKTSVSSSNLPKDEKASSSDAGDKTQSRKEPNDGLQIKSNEADQNSNVIVNEEVDAEIENMLTLDFLHLVAYICRVISQMRHIIRMEGTLASIIVFLSTLNQQIVLSKRGLLHVLEVIKEILFIRPHLRLLIHLMRLLVSTAQYPLILQKLCVNAGPDAAFRDRWKNIWFFTRDACPLQILITLLENVTDERIPDGISEEAWYMYRAKLGYCFIHWLTIALGQKGHHVSWLCCAVSEDIHEELKEEMEIPLNTNGPNDSKHSDKTKDSETAVATSSTSVAEEKMEAKGNEGVSAEDIPTRPFFNLKITGSDEEETEWDEKEPICCCRRWTMNIIVNFLYTILSDFEAVIQSSLRIEIIKDSEQSYFKSRTLPKIANKELIFEQSRIIRLGIFVLRELLRRGHPEFNTPGGEGFQWNHYTIKGAVLANGQVVTKQYDHKNCDGGPIGGRYLLFLTKLQRSLKHSVKNFCPQTEMALQELLEVENCIENDVNSDAEEDDSKFWDQIEKIGHI